MDAPTGAGAGAAAPDRVDAGTRRSIPRDVLPLLHRLARLAPDGSDEHLFANLHLAELLVERDPWRAALYARRVLAHRPDDDRGWATLALCQTLLGNYRFAVTAYHHALASAPKNPWYAHNLGHLLDVALGRAEDAVAGCAAPTRAPPTAARWPPATPTPSLASGASPTRGASSTAP